MELNLEGNPNNKDLVESCMIEAGKYICKEIPMEVETEIGDFWKH